MNGVIFHKNSEISKAAKQEKAKDKLLSVLQLTHPCFNVYIFIQEVMCVCVCMVVAGRSFLSQTNLNPLILSHLSSVVQLPPWKRHFLPCKALLESSSCALNRFD